MASWWITPAVQAMALVATGVRTAVEIRAGRRSAWIWGPIAAAYLFALCAALRGAWRG